MRRRRRSKELKGGRRRRRRKKQTEEDQKEEEIEVEEEKKAVFVVLHFIPPIPLESSSTDGRNRVELGNSFRRRTIVFAWSGAPPGVKSSFVGTAFYRWRSQLQVNTIYRHWLMEHRVGSHRAFAEWEGLSGFTNSIDEADSHAAQRLLSPGDLKRSD